jgi:hypothetical protein
MSIHTKQLSVFGVFILMIIIPYVEGTNKQECIICREEISSASLQKLSCEGQHSFHQLCINNCFRRKATCPICRQFIPEAVPILISNKMTNVKYYMVILESILNTWGYIGYLLAVWFNRNTPLFVNVNYLICLLLYPLTSIVVTESEIVIRYHIHDRAAQLSHFKSKIIKLVIFIDVIGYILQSVLAFVQSEYSTNIILVIQLSIFFYYSTVLEILKKFVRDFENTI